MNLDRAFSQSRSRSTNAIVLACLLASALAACSSDDPGGGTGSACAMCDAMGDKCGWSPQVIDSCTGQCQQRESKNLPACKHEYDKAYACFEDEANWDCNSGVRCFSEISDYDYCTSTGGGCDAAKVATCAVCDTVALACDWSSLERCNCRSSCDTDLTLEGDCQGPFDALVTCYAEASRWRCDSPGTISDCDPARLAYDNCRYGGDTSWKCQQAETGVPAWTAIGTLPKGVNGFAVAADGVAYAAGGDLGGGGAGVYKSQDDGKTWTLTPGALPGGRIEAIAASNGALYVIVDMGVHVSPDGGASWTKKTAETFFSPPDAFLVADPFEASVLYSSNQEGPVRTMDSGATWKPIATGLPLGTTQTAEVQTMAASPDAAGTIFAATGSYGHGGSGVFKSTNRGDQWTAANAGMLSSTVITMAFGGAGHGYAVDSGGKLFETADGAQSWSSVTIDHACMEWNHTQSLASWVLLQGDSALVQLNTGHLIRREGGSWTLVARSWPVEQGWYPVKAMAVLGTAVLAAVQEQGVFRVE